MSRLDELIRELCPSGVEYKELREILAIKNGSDYKHLGEGAIPVYGSGGIMTYVDRYAYNKPSVLIPRKGSIDKLYYVDEPFWNVDTIFYTDIDCEKVIPRYVYFCLQMAHLEQYNTAGGVPSLTQAVLNKVRIPVPPLPIQREIVRILDSFTELTAELKDKLTAELTARKKQYEFYRDKLLTFDGATGDVVWKALGEITLSLKTGLNPRKNFKLNGDGADCYYITGKDVYGNAINISEHTDKITLDTVKLINRRASLHDNTLLFVSTGTGTVGRMAVIEKYTGDWNVSETMYVITADLQKALTRYLFHFLNSSIAKAQYEPKISKGSVPHLKVSDLLNVKIPIPSLIEQQRIISILDRFDALCNDLTSGLPAEIEARQKQYEYYRDKLLTFKAKQ